MPPGCTRTCESKGAQNCWECGNKCCQKHRIASTRHRVGWLCLRPECHKNHEEPTAWRVNIAPDGKPAYAIALNEKVVGVGWGVPDDANPPRTWLEFEMRAREHYANSAWKAPLRSFENGMAIGDFVWAYDKGRGRYHLGRIKSPWQYSAKEPFLSSGLRHVRDCEWMQVPVSKVPSSVLHGRSIVRHHPGLSEYSKQVYNELTDTGYRYRLSENSMSNLWDFLGPDDCEDAVAFFLQIEKGFLIQPSTSKISTPDIEFMVWQKHTGEGVGVQVKSGSQAIDLALYATKPEKYFVFSSSGSYRGKLADNTLVLDPKEVESSLRRNKDRLSMTLRFWIDRVAQKP